MGERDDVEVCADFLWAIAGLYSQENGPTLWTMSDIGRWYWNWI